MNFTLNIRNVALFFTIVFSGFYLTRVLSLSPVYITFLIGSIVIVGYGIFNFSSIHISKASVIFLLYIVYILTTQPFLNPDFNTLINVLFSLFYFIIVINISLYSNNKILIKYLEYLINILLLL